MSDFFRRKFSSIELASAILFAVAAILLQLFFLQHAGGLWRDEICVVNIATLPTLGQVWDAMPHDHCPMLFLLLVRGWAAAGLGNTDAELRVLGLLCGLVLLATLWLASRMMGRGLPLISLALAGLNFTVIRYGDSIRAYGLATALIVFTMSLIWCCIEKPSWHRWLLAGLLAVLSVQTLYQTAFLLLAVCLAGAAVCLRRRQSPRALGVLSVGLVAAISLLPYVKPLHAAQSWWLLSKVGVSFAGFLSWIGEATGMLLGVWVMLILLAAVLGLGRGLMQKASDETPEQNDLILFASLALVTGLAGFGFFIRLSGLPTEPWYYIPALVFAAVCCDTILQRVHRAALVWVLVIAGGISVFACASAWSVLQTRQTNGDLAAMQVAQQAKPDDLIIVHPWYYGIAFARYYRGTAPWTTLPPLADYRFHRYDLVKSQIRLADPTKPVFEKVEAALRSGHRIWIVGDIPVSRPNRPAPANLPPAPNGPQGWYDEPYSHAWGARLGYFLAHNTATLKPVGGFPTNSINPRETMTVSVASGWQTNSP